MKFVLMALGLAGFVFGLTSLIRNAEIIGSARQLDLGVIERSQTAPIGSRVRITGHFTLYQDAEVNILGFGKAALTEPERIKDKDGTIKPGPDVNFAIYPIISRTNPFSEQTIRLWRKYGSLKAIPAEDWPRLERIRVFVRTNDFHSSGHLPPVWEFEPEAFGVLVPIASGLDSQTLVALKKNYPDINFDNVLLLQKNWGGFGHAVGPVLLMILGFGLAGVAIFWMLPDRKASADDAEQEDNSTDSQNSSVQATTADGQSTKPAEKPSI